MLYQEICIYIIIFVLATIIHILANLLQYLFTVSFVYSIDLTPLVKAYTSGREADYVTSVLDCATALQYRAVEVVLNVLVEGLDKRAALVAVKPFPEQCVSAEPKVTCIHTYVRTCVRCGE